ncbi:MAG: hypothetical protein ACK4KZ_05975, partial [Aquificaceae bacterium]
RGMRVPEILLSGNHNLIKLWELWHSIERTLKLRPDLIPTDLTKTEAMMIEGIKRGLSFEEWLREVGYHKAIRLLKD